MLPVEGETDSTGPLDHMRSVVEEVVHSASAKSGAPFFVGGRLWAGACPPTWVAARERADTPDRPLRHHETLYLEVRWGRQRGRECRLCHASPVVETHVRSADIISS